MKRGDVVGRAIEDLRTGRSFLCIVVGPNAQIDVTMWHEPNVKPEAVLHMTANVMKQMLAQIGEERTRERIVIPELTVGPPPADTGAN